MSAIRVAATGAGRSSGLRRSPRSSPRRRPAHLGQGAGASHLPRGCVAGADRGVRGRDAGGHRAECSTGAETGPRRAQSSSNNGPCLLPQHGPAGNTIGRHVARPGGRPSSIATPANCFAGYFTPATAALRIELSTATSRMPIGGATSRTNHATSCGCAEQSLDRLGPDRPGLNRRQRKRAPPRPSA
jgi:hypothetical protein